jgi:hypothetical protein
LDARWDTKRLVSYGGNRQNLQTSGRLPLMKIYANGVQVFHFWDGRWRLKDVERKYGL